MNDIFDKFAHNLVTLFAEPSDKLALAVSGGSDSMALLVLTNEFAKSRNIEISVITVDHHLRDVSRQEAEYVGEICSELDLTHVILDWQEPAKVNIQANARKARYDLLTSWCHDNGISYLLTGHHLDDQVENFFIRLSRGSGLFGLIDHRLGLYNGINVLRPLFNIPKSELQDYLKERGIRWYEDASNSDPKYLRSSVRHWLAQMPGELEPELFKQRVLQSQQHLRSAAAYIQKALDAEMEGRVVFHDRGAEYRPGGEDLIVHMTLSHLLCVVGGEEEMPRSESVIRLRQDLGNGKKRATLHGCVVSLKDGVFTIGHEKGRTKNLS
jgi:tRNA(Ile)-lysidine synthase